MSDEAPAPAATPTGNQNLIIGLVLGAMVLILFLLLLNTKGGLLGGGGESSEIAQLRRDLDAKRSAIDSERARLGLPPLSGGSSGLTATALATRISDDSGNLASLVGQMQAVMAEKDSRLNTAEATRKALTQQITELQNQLDEGRLAAAETQTLRGDLASAQALLESANRTVDDLRKRLAGAPDEAAMSTLRQSLDDAIGERDALKSQLKALRDEMRGMVDASQLDDYNKLRDQVAKLVPENNKLRYELQRLQAQLDRTRLFAEKVDDLPAAAKLLYTELAKLETVTGEQLQKEYARIDQELKARVIDKVSFQTGSSQIDLDKVEEIRRASEAADPDSFFLVVGYASKTGDFASNKTLSAERATTIASVTNLNLKDTQGVQAVFLGQTDRFSSSDPLRNQRCEVWEIRK